MRWSLRLATVLGIRIEVHVTFLLLLLAYVAMSRAANPAEVAVVVGDVLLLFGCVLLHELGHALMARRFGVNTREIVLTGIGGIARLERMPERPLHEMMVALAGPAVNVVLATLVGVFLLQRHESWNAITEAAIAGHALEFLFYVNVVMFFFNLIPAFPMDGGRVLRAVLAMMMPFARATRYASLVGQGFAVVFAVVGTLVTHNLALVAIALFVFLTAREERALVQTRSSLTGMPVSAAMVTAFLSLETRHELSHAVDLLLAGEQKDFPVLEDGTFLGMLSRDDLLRGMRTEGPDSPVGRLVRLDVSPIEASMPLDAALQRMSATRQSALPVMLRGRLVGMLTLENIRELLLVQEARQRHAGTA
ncbi:MAG: site-2 protease family protein [Candidatus Eisenbacteria bacterium]|jgi:Zn-dependent protease|nr:site-2 protease family protein [Candidatus Eisenbacteria bacterium]MBP8137119.1 site-2 protease family protein [Candidatus Eisenbacteria bacterium]